MSECHVSHGHKQCGEDYFCSQITRRCEHCTVLCDPGRGTPRDCQHQCSHFDHDAYLVKVRAVTEKNRKNHTVAVTTSHRPPSVITTHTINNAQSGLQSAVMTGSVLPVLCALIGVVVILITLGLVIIAFTSQLNKSKNTRSLHEKLMLLIKYCPCYLCYKHARPQWADSERVLNTSTCGSTNIVNIAPPDSGYGDSVSYTEGNGGKTGSQVNVNNETGQLSTSVHEMQTDKNITRTTDNPETQAPVSVSRTVDQQTNPAPVHTDKSAPTNTTSTGASNRLENHQKGATAAKGLLISLREEGEKERVTNDKQFDLDCFSSTGVKTGDDSPNTVLDHSMAVGGESEDETPLLQDAQNHNLSNTHGRALNNNLSQPLLPPDNDAMNHPGGAVGGDDDSGCGSEPYVRHASRGASEEFNDLNRQMYRQCGVDVDDRGHPVPRDPPLPIQAPVQAAGVPLHALFPGNVEPSNRILYDKLKKIDWVMGYHSAGRSIEVYVNLGSLDPHDIELQLANRTGAPVEKFHVKENEEKTSLDLY